jgi:Ser/Thr protein kinase RdoA (MazF antagonist)
MTRIDPHAALCHWPLDAKTCELAAERENLVYRVVDSNGQAFALRVHRAGYRTASEIQSELQWMVELESGGVSVPRPLASKKGEYIAKVDGVLVSVLTWLSGTPLGIVARPLILEDRTGTFHRFGAAMAKMHDISDRWERPQDFSRPAWDLEGLTGALPSWGPYWENPALTDEQRKIVIAARDKARAAIQQHALDFGLIHADLVRENVLLDGRAVKFIDFDDSGTGYRLFEIATALLKNKQEPDYPALRSALLCGYRSLRPLDTALLQPFLMLRAFSYLGWMIPRFNESGAALRNQRSLAASMALAREYLG